MTEASNIYVSFATMDNFEILRKSGEDLEVEAHEVDVFLTQSETLGLPVGKMKTQLNWTYQEGSITKRACTEIAIVNIAPNLINEVIE